MLQKSKKSQEYQLRENDVIKLGRVKFRIRELHVGQESDAYQNDSCGIDEISEFVRKD